MSTVSYTTPDKDNDPDKTVILSNASAARIPGSTSSELNMAETCWDDVLAQARKGGIGQVPGREKVLYIGDIHGASPSDLDDDLRRVGLLDSRRRWQNPQGRYLVFMGDLIDRGQHGLAIYDRTTELQKQANGHVVRIKGNHEIYHVAGVPEWIGAPAIHGLQERLFRDILSGSVVAAFCEGNTIYTHAGIDLGFFPEYVGKSNDYIVKSLNQRLVSSVRSLFANSRRRSDDIEASALAFTESDAIFDASYGIFWTRGNIANDQFQQVVGHTPQREGIRDNPGDRVKYVDVGRVFGETGHFNLERSRAIGANSANTAFVRQNAHDMRTFVDFVRNGGCPFGDRSRDRTWGAKVDPKVILKRLKDLEVEKIELKSGIKVRTDQLFRALETLGRIEPLQAQIFIADFFAQFPIDVIAAKTTNDDVATATEQLRLAKNWLYQELSS